MEFALALWWLVAFAALTLAGAPLAALAFPGFRDRGATFALPLSLAVLTVVTFLLGHVFFTFWTVLIALWVLLLGTALALRRGVSLSLSHYAETMVVFSLAFAFLVAVRAVDPAVHAPGGEKFLDYGLLQTLLRATVLPPEDFWFAGERLNYYYGGHLLTVALAWLTGTEARFAYNLALAGFYATLVTGAYGLAATIAAHHGSSPRKAGALSAFFVGFAGTLATPGRLLLGVLPDDLAARFGHVFLDGIRMPYEEALVVATNPETLSYWFGRYIIPDTIHVTPFWEFLNGDLHAHLMSTPFLVFTAALCYAYTRTPADALLRRRLLVFGALPAMAGLLTYINTWSGPTALGLTGLTLVFAPTTPRSLLTGSTNSTTDQSLRGECTRLVTAGLLLGGVALLAALWAAPYLVLSRPPNEGLGVLPSRSDLSGLLLVYGLFFAIFARYFAPRVTALLREHDLWRAETVVVGAVVIGPGTLLATQFTVGAILLLLSFLAVGWFLLRTDRDVGFETLLFIAGLGLLLIVEFVYAKVWPHDPNALRWNTVYKVSMQVWVLWGVGGAVALARALDGGSPLERSLLPTVSRSRGRTVANVALAVLVLSSATFGGLALAKHFGGPLTADRPVEPTLDATRFVEQWHPDEAAAFEWLSQREGQPNMVSHPGATYTWANPASVFTGIPTMVGWEHEKGYHGEEAVEIRERRVKTIYVGSWDIAAQHLLTYDIEYIYVSPAERDAYDVRDFAAQEGISVAFQHGSVTIYAVDQSVLRERYGKS
ncbi:DUF2298 domain-containing protein [Haladaptatus sp. GCM10025707]|uniref:DUF2298 domain-containing protein n=1 Tax=unclassified Haladaptatus TaxID=2622732 RepID=UPI0023E88B8D|nr:DUF2298 domain-containing protein [Haladaptatus sp. QDMS2]